MATLQRIKFLPGAPGVFDGRGVSGCSGWFIFGKGILDDGEEPIGLYLHSDGVWRESVREGDVWSGYFATEALGAEALQKYLQVSRRKKKK